MVPPVQIYHLSVVDPQERESMSFVRLQWLNRKTLMINVRQRQYAFALKESNKTLVTRNILFCTALFGFDKDNGVSFLCHFDSPRSADDLPRILMELRSLKTTRLNFQCYILNGSRLANCIRTKKVRQKLFGHLRNSSLCQQEPIDLGYIKKGLRRKVTINACDFTWNTKDYTFSKCHPVSACSKVMSKASGSA